MARKTEVVEYFVDDVDGGAANETVAFSIDGASYEIDLNKRNAKRLRSDFEKWTSVARKARAARRPARRRSSASGVKNESATIRAWAAENGIAVPSRGRIPRSIVEQYQNKA
jgi:hypothetical protein